MNPVQQIKEAVEEAAQTVAPSDLPPLKPDYVTPAEFFERLVDDCFAHVADLRKALETDDVKRRPSYGPYMLGKIDAYSEVAEYFKTVVQRINDYNAN